MSDNQTFHPSDELAQIIESAGRLGVELDEAEALQWLAAMAAQQSGDDVVFDDESNVFGHRVAMLDFSPQELARFREIGELVGLPNRPGVVETALALSGSSAQSKIQSHPGDCDYFERVNIKAPSRQEATLILADLLREKALSTARGPSHQLIEVKLGSYPYDVVRDGRPVKRGAPISWSVEEIRAGRIEAFRPDGTQAVIRWEEAASDPGWCKLDWVVAEPIRRQIANASNMLDVTWEAPDGAIHPLDGYLDPYFQEVYLEAAAIPIFSKLSQHVSADALDEYVRQLEREVAKYLTKDLNYGKAAKRMYNVFRLTGHYVEAAFLRELFDEPATALYQVWSLVRTLDDAARADASIPVESLLAQADHLILSVVTALEGEAESELVLRLLRLRDELTRQGRENELSVQVEAVRATVIDLVNTFFYQRMICLPSIKAYIESIQESGGPTQAADG